MLSCTTFCNLLTVAHNHQHFSLLSQFLIPDKFPDPDGMDARLFLDQWFQNNMHEVKKYLSGSPVSPAPPPTYQIPQLSYLSYQHFYHSFIRRRITIRRNCTQFSTNKLRTACTVVKCVDTRLLLLLLHREAD